MGQLKVVKQRNKGREDFAERGLCRYGSKCLRTHPTNEEVRRMLAEWWQGLTLVHFSAQL